MTLFMALMEELGILFETDPREHNFTLFQHILFLLESLEKQEKTPLEFILYILPYLVKSIASREEKKINAKSGREFLKLLLGALRKSDLTSREKELVISELEKIIPNAPASLNGYVLWTYLEIKRR